MRLFRFILKSTAVKNNAFKVIMLVAMKSTMISAAIIIVTLFLCLSMFISFIPHSFAEEELTAFDDDNLTMLNEILRHILNKKTRLDHITRYTEIETTIDGKIVDADSDTSISVETITLDSKGENVYSDDDTIRFEAADSDVGTMTNSLFQTTINQEISKADPETKITDTGNDAYSRITKSDTNQKAVRYNQITEQLKFWADKKVSGDTSRAWNNVDSDLDGSFLIVGGSVGRLWTSDDSGGAWTERRPAGDVNGAWFVSCDSDGSNLFVANIGGRCYTSSNSGVDWTERQPAGDVDVTWFHVDSSSTGAGLIIGSYDSASGGRLWTSINSGVTWTERQPAGASNEDWYGVASDSDGSNLIVCNYTGRLYTSASGGAIWTERQPAGAVNKCWRDVASDDDGSFLMATIRTGRMYTSSNSGVDWTERRPAGDVDKSWKVNCDNDGSNLIAGDWEGRLYISEDSGVTWSETQPNGDTNYRWYGIASDSDGSNLIAGVDSAINGRIYTMSSPTQTTEVEVWSSVTNATLNIEGTQTFGDPAGVTVLDGVTIDFDIAGTTELEYDTGVLFPTTDDAVSLGKTAQQFDNFYLDGLAYIDGFGEDTDLGDFDVKSIDKLEGYDSAVYIDMGADTKIEIAADAIVDISTPLIKINNASIEFEGTADDFETTLAFTDTTTPDKTITFQDASGIVVTDATACADIEGTHLSIATGTLNVGALKDLVATAPLLVNATTNVNDVIVGTDADITFSMPAATNAVNGYATSSHITAIEANTNKVTESTTVTSPLVLTTYDIAIPAATNAAAGHASAAHITAIEANTAHAADNTQAHSDYFLNTGSDIAGAGAGFTWTFNASAGSDCVMTFGDGTINVSTGELQEGGVAVLTSEVDGSTTNEINTITCPDANVTAGLGITFAQSGTMAITEAADTITFTVTETDPNALLTAGTDNVKDTHIDWGTAATQISAVDLPIADAGVIITATEVEGALQEHRTAIDLNTDKNTNVSTALSAGTVNATTYGITSDGGADDIVLPEADTTNAGLLGSDKWDEIVANSLHSADNTQAHSDYLLNSGADTMAGALTINPGTLFLQEQTDASADVAGQGQIWVNTATPNELWWTNDAGTDVQLGAAGSATAYDDIGNPDASGSITMGAFTGTYTSATDGWGGLIISDTVADITVTTTLLTLGFTDDGDGDGVFLHCLDNSSADTRFKVLGTGQTDIRSASWPPLTVTRETAGTNIITGELMLKSETTGVMAAGYGAGIDFILRDNSAVDNYICNIAAIRAGADNLANLKFNPTNDNVLLDAGLTVGSDTEAGDNNLRVEGNSVLVGNITKNATQWNSTDNIDADAIVDGSTNAAITLIQETNWDNHIADNTQAHSDYLLNNANDTMVGVLTADGLTLGQDENITLGAQTLDHDGTDFVFSDSIKTTTLNITGGQIAFPATAVPSADPNTIDDYEEGTWTSVLGGSGGESGQSYNLQDGYYVKIGKAVTATFYILLSTKGTITGNLEIKTLPFVSQSPGGTAPMLTSYATYWTLTADHILIGSIDSNDTSITIREVDYNSDVPVALVTGAVANNSSIVGLITYFAT